MFNSKLNLAFLFLFVAFTQGCGQRLSSAAKELLSSYDEIPLCNKQYSYTNGLTISGQAQFYKRTLNFLSSNSEITNATLYNPIDDPLPIPYAEVSVLDSNYNVVQCGYTDSDGQILGLDGDLLTIPKTAQKYYVRVYARINKTLSTNFIASASVKEDIYSNKLYYIESSFTSNGYTTTSFELKAYARQTDDLKVLGGAFNIYNDFVQTYLYLNDNLSSSINKTCLSNTLEIYWKAGFNPEQYNYPNEDPQTISSNSFYQKETNRLFVTGGQVGDMSLSNTDHFDDYVIIHEIGHSLEYNCGLLTKGGTHALIVRIDPRLAWHESWANFIAGAVMHDRLNFIDKTLADKIAATGETYGWTFLSNTIGFTDTYQSISNGDGFLLDLKNSGSNPGAWQTGSYLNVQFDPVVPSTYPGEGHFREGAISRSLFKLTHACGTYCTDSPLSFENMWKADFDSTNGMAAATYFVNSNEYLEKLKIITSGSWTTSSTSVVENEAMQIYSEHSTPPTGTQMYVVSGTSYVKWIPYGTRLVANGSTPCSTLTAIQPRADDPYFTGVNSDQRYSNHFYMIDTSILPNLQNITVQFTFKQGTPVDHDLLLFNKSYHFNEDYGCSSTGATNTDNCDLSYYTPIRTYTSDVVSYNRTPASLSSVADSSYSKALTSLKTSLSSSTQYILDIRSYTANKSISTSTLYYYTISSNLGYLCPDF